MRTVRFGGKKGVAVQLVESDEHLAVRTVSREPLDLAGLKRNSRRLLDPFRPVLRFRRAGVEVLEATTTRGAKSARDSARRVLKKDPSVQFAGRVLVEKSTREPVIYTQNLFVKFHDDAGAGEIRRVLAKHKLESKKSLSFARNAVFAGAPDTIGQGVFDIAHELLARDSVELCHPELVRQRRTRGVFAGQWHLKKMTIDGSVVDAHASVEAAWALTRGENTTIAVIDDGFDLDHEEFSSSGKVLWPRDVSFDHDDPRPGNGDNHGTSCAGVALADGRFGASGVAPSAKFIPIRSESALGSMDEAEAFQWAADHGADVISCSWGPEDGKWWDPADPAHNRAVHLPDSTRLAIDYAVRTGRNGLGCVICWAAGNGNESVDNDGYARYEKVMAVAACSDRSIKSDYSDFGNALWCAFPSNDFETPRKTTGIWTTDRSGSVGYNPGQPSKGDLPGNYTNSFGGTSSAAPGVAGLAALVISRNPSLTWEQVRGVIRDSCDKIDGAGGSYDAAGHSPKYGYGRVNARAAVELATPGENGDIVKHGVTGNKKIKDNKSTSLTVPVADTAPMVEMKVKVDIEHTYIGDLIVKLVPPAGTGVAPILLHNREGGGTDNLKRVYDQSSTPALAQLSGKVPTGRWKLVVQDKEVEDTGTLRGVELQMTI